RVVGGTPSIYGTASAVHPPSSGLRDEPARRRAPGQERCRSSGAPPGSALLCASSDTPAAPAIVIAERCAGIRANRKRGDQRLLDRPLRALRGAPTPLSTSRVSLPGGLDS